MKITVLLFIATFSLSSFSDSITNAVNECVLFRMCDEFEVRKSFDNETMANYSKYFTSGIDKIEFVDKNFIRVLFKNREEIIVPVFKKRTMDMFERIFRRNKQKSFS